jgi:hypothetical protein
MNKRYRKSEKGRRERERDIEVDLWNEYLIVLSFLFWQIEN